MPSWNIHIAHAERTLAQAHDLGIRDADAFLLGNLLPDVYVGYMVPDITRKVEYRETHFADPGHVPEPRYWEFFERHCARDASGWVDDLLLGCWAHLVADHDYNHHNNAFIRAHGIAPGERTRTRKQADFDLFGRTLAIRSVPRLTGEVLAQCARFPQYELDERDMAGAVEVAARIVEKNAREHVDGTPAYDMLDAAFFSQAFDEVTMHICTGLAAYAAAGDDWGLA